MPTGVQRPTPAVELVHSTTLLQTLDELCKVRSLIQAAWMAAGNLARKSVDLMQSVLDVASEQLDAARAKLCAALQHPEEAVNV